MSSKLVIGTRGSELALWQANYVAARLLEQGVSIEIKVIKTQGDKIRDIGFDKMEGKGFFTKELEDALLKKDIDLAVHSHKDLTTTFPEGLIIAAVSKREDPSELLLIHPNAVDGKMHFSLKKNAKLGTSSARRKSQFLAFRPDCTVADLRGNVTTRIQKVMSGEYDAILIAAAGVERLGCDTGDLQVEKLSPKEFIPAPAQGVLAMQCRAEDTETITALKPLNNPEVAMNIAVERKVLNLFDGGCQLPLGVYCERELNDNDEMVFRTWVSKADAWDKKPKYLFSETATSEGLAEKLVERIHAIKPCPVFISRGARKHDLFSEVLTGNGFQVTAQALIEMKSIAFKTPASIDWVFFASKNAVRFFFEGKPNLTNGVKLGAVGISTANEIRKFGKRAEFIGQGTDTKRIGKQFAALVGNRSVAFPQAKGSMRSIQSQLTRQDSAIDLTVYETIKKECGVRSSEFGVLVFTSPSNVESFLEKNTISSEQKVVAMGDATAHALKKAGVRVHAQPLTFTDLGLLQAVYKVC